MSFAQIRHIYKLQQGNCPILLQYVHDAFYSNFGVCLVEVAMLANGFNQMRVFPVSAKILPGQPAPYPFVPLAKDPRALINPLFRPIDPYATPITYDYRNGFLPPDTAAEIVLRAQDDLKNPAVLNGIRVFIRWVIDERISLYDCVISESLAVENFVRDRVRYTRDPIGVELVYSLSRTGDLWTSFLRWAEDCDTQAQLVFTMLLAIGRMSRMVIAGFDQDQPENFSHIFTEVLTPPINEYKSRWLIVDPSLSPQTTIQMASDIRHAMVFYP